MPGWHEATLDLQKAKRVRMVGIIEEQHPDRARLFMQWKEMGWPILVDSLNLLGVRAVPITLFVDEHGIVRGRPGRGRKAREDLERFLETESPAPEDELPRGSVPEPEALAARARELDPRRSDAPPAGARAGGESGAEVDDSEPAASHPEAASAWMAAGDAFFLRGRTADLTRSVEAYRRALELGAPPEARFRLGVALRRRYESEARREGDLQAAFRAWEEALAARPNQYIWRRRIQQYGPRLEKPYAFYDWVSAARREIRERGDTPVPLGSEPRGAEIARPEKRFVGSESALESPDPEGRIRRDGATGDGAAGKKGPLIRAEVGAVPKTVRPGKTSRIHVVLRPNEKRGAHWNNEAGQLAVWIEPPDGVEVDRRKLTAENARRAVSREPRRVEFEARIGKAVEPGKLAIPAYALYYVCEDADGVCMYLRQDIDVALEVE